MSDVLELTADGTSVPEVIGHTALTADKVLFTEISLRRPEPDEVASFVFYVRKWGLDENDVVVVAPTFSRSYTLDDVDAATTEDNQLESDALALLSGQTIGKQLLVLQAIMEQVAYNIAVDEGILVPPGS